jgi:anti-sigma28 factor (negative regulator of flagellin synthesis)
MRISGSGIPQGIEAGGQSNAPRPASTVGGTENHQTSDLLAISAAGEAMSARGERVQQLRVQVESGNYSQSSAVIGQRMISDALSRGA